MKTIKKIIAITLMLALVVGCFAAMPLTVSAMPYSDDFDATATYTAGHEDTGSCVWSSGGTVYQFYVTDGTGNKFYSMCASDTGDQIGVNAEYEADTISKTDQIVAALNYINNEYGSLNTWSGYQGGLANLIPEANTKLISQLVVWAIINDKAPYTLTGEAYGFTYDPSLVNSAVSNVLENYVGATGDIDIVYLKSSFITELNLPSQPQIVPIVKPETPGGEIELKKTVNGVAVNLWLSGKYADDREEILNAISFDLYGTYLNAANELKIMETRLSGMPSGKVDPNDVNGIINFDFGVFRSLGFTAGWYAIQERYDDGSLAAEIFQGTAPALFIYIDGDSKFGSVFDYESFYTIVNGYNSPKHPTGLGYEGLNNGGDFFYIGVKSVNNGIEYASFCAHGGSKNFAGESGLGCSKYKVVQRADMDDLENPEMDPSYEAILVALNWIENNVGSLQAKDGPYGLVTTQRVVAQTVIWALLGNIDVASAEFGTVNLTAEEKAYVMAALAATDTGQANTIVDLVYMVCEHDHDFGSCQPQLVPIYAGFNNRVIEDPLGKLEVCAKAVLKTTKETILEKVQCEITPWEEWTQYVSPSYSSVTATNANYKNALTFDSKNNPQGINVVTNSNHFTYAKLSRAALLAEGGVDLALVVGNKVDQVGTGNAAIVDGKLVLTFDNIYGKAGYGAVAFNGFMPVVKNGNIHSVGIFSANSKNVIDIYSIGSFQSADKKGANYDKDWAEITKNMKDSDEFVYLYVHFGNVQFDLGKEKTDSGKDKIEHRSEKVIKTTDTTSELTVDFVVYDSEDNVVAEADFGALKPGMYTVVYNDGRSAPTSKPVEVKAGETAKSKYFKEYTEDAAPKIITKYLKPIVNPVDIRTTVTTVK